VCTLIMRAALEKLLTQGRDDALLRFGLGSECLKVDALHSAVEHFQRAVTLKPTYIAAWKMLGKVYVQQGLLDKAEGAWKQGLLVAHADKDRKTINEIERMCKLLTQFQEDQRRQCA
jgi:uncharacterized protein HemY